MNRQKLGTVYLKNDSSQHKHTCYFGAELRMCVLKIAFLQKAQKSHFW